MAKLCGTSGHVFSFEPTINQYRYLTENIKANGLGNVDAYNLGAWSSETNIKGKVNVGHEGEIKVISLDSILAQPVPQKVDFIKIDVDGAEPEVLKGLEQTIINNPQLKLVIEYYPKYIENLGLNPQDVIDFLDKYFTYERIGGDFANLDYWNYDCIRRV